jgi:hypothetical protein
VPGQGDPDGHRPVADLAIVDLHHGPAQPPSSSSLHPMSSRRHRQLTGAQARLIWCCGMCGLDRTLDDTGCEPRADMRRVGPSARPRGIALRLEQPAPGDWTRMSLSTTSTAAVKTDRAPRYGKQLVSHFGRRLIATWDETHARGTLDIGDNAGRMTIECTPDTLNISIVAHQLTDERITQVEDAVTRHLKHFSVRDPLHVRWVRSAR